MYEVTDFQKKLVIDNSRPYGTIIVYFGSKDSFKKTGRIPLIKFLSLSQILDNDKVAYDPESKMFITSVESSKLIIPPKGKIS